MACDNELAGRAIEAAERLFDAPGENRDIFEPCDGRTAEAALLRFGELFDQLCAFRTNPATENGLIRPGKSAQSGH